MNTRLSDGDKLRTLTTRVSNDDIQAVLEALVDTHGARLVAENLVEVFHDKAEHLTTLWQDDRSAKLWRGVAMKLGNAVHFQNLEWPT